MHNGIERLKQAWNENPMQVLIVGSLVVTATAKLLDASTSRANSRAWNMEVQRRMMKGTR
jgi:hypothetical protein